MPKGKKFKNRKLSDRLSKESDAESLDETDEERVEQLKEEDLNRRVQFLWKAIKSRLRMTGRQRRQNAESAGSDS
jgi:hypothetical protein